MSEAELELRTWQDTIANDDSKLKITRVTVNKDPVDGQKRYIQKHQFNTRGLAVARSISRDIILPTNNSCLVW